MLCLEKRDIFLRNFRRVSEAVKNEGIAENTFERAMD